LAEGQKGLQHNFRYPGFNSVAGWHGQGRKARFWSPILLAVRNEETGSLEAVCKCISGFTDSFYKANKEFYNKESGTNVLGGKPGMLSMRAGIQMFGLSRKRCGKWLSQVSSVPVFTIYGTTHTNLTFRYHISPTYTAAIGLVSDEKGLSLRFPRFLKKRDDKGIEEASTSEFLAGLWRKQEEKAPTSTTKNVEGEDDDE